MFFVRVANKGVTGAEPVRVADKGLKVTCFDIFSGEFLGVGKKEFNESEKRKHSEW